MWIIPKNLPIYRSVLDTKGLVEDSEEFSQVAERSLMWRSKPSQSQTWSRRWKRVIYIQRLSTQTLRPSHSKNFVTEYLSCRQDSLVSRSRLRAEALPQRIRDTFTPLSQEESQSADQLMLFSKTSKELSGVKQPMGSRYSNMSSEIWKKEVTRLRGEYSQRKKLALHTSGRESLSWPTATSSDGEGGRIETILNKGGFKSKRKTSGQIRGAKLRDAVETYENWPTADTTNIGDGTPWEKSKRLLKERRARVKKAVKEGKTKAGSGRSVNLAMAVQREKSREEKNWATPQLMDFRSDVRKPEERSEKANKGGCSNLREQVHNWKTNKEKKNWSEESSKGWPTPKSRDWKGGLGTDKARQRNDLDKIVLLDGQQDQDKSNTSGKSRESWGTPCLYEYNKRPFAEINSKQASLVRSLGRNKIDGKLNPNWVEQLMGLPVGWTQLPIEWID